jgi:hypothetical protein
VNLTVPVVKLLKNNFDSTTNIRTVHLEIHYEAGEWSALKFAAPLVKWSLSPEIPSAPQGHYFVRHIGGYGISTWDLEFEVRGSEPFDVYTCINHFDHSDDIKAVLPVFPDWTVPIAFQSVGASFRIE